MDEHQELGLFPLDMVMLPSEPVPLHLFEPRYRELFADCVLDARPMVILASLDGERAEIGCAGQVEAMTKRLADGRLNVVVRGAWPVRVLEPTIGGSLYETAIVALVRDEPADATAEMKERARSLFAELAGPERAPQIPEGTPLSYAIAGAIEMPTATKQELLETRDEPTRLAKVVELLERVDKAAGHARIAAERAQRNGRVSTPS